MEYLKHLTLNSLKPFEEKPFFCSQTQKLFIQVIILKPLTGDTTVFLLILTAVHIFKKAAHLFA